MLEPWNGGRGQLLLGEGQLPLAGGGGQEIKGLFLVIHFDDATGEAHSNIVKQAERPVRVWGQVHV